MRMRAIHESAEKSSETAALAVPPTRATGDTLTALGADPKRSTELTIEFT